MGYDVTLLERIASPENEYNMQVDPRKVSESVLLHLQKMLNVRQGSSSANPDYGLPDFNQLISEFPSAIQELRKAIKQCIEKYEPRLRRVRVESLADDDDPLSLRFEIHAHLIIDDHESKVWYETMFDPAGRANIRG